jgi:hypothetical protein
LGQHPVLGSEPIRGIVRRRLKMPYGLDDGADILIRKAHVPELQNLKLLRTFGRSIPGVKRVADRGATEQAKDCDAQSDFAAERSRDQQD